MLTREEQSMLWNDIKRLGGELSTLSNFMQNDLDEFPPTRENSEELKAVIKRWKIETSKALNHLEKEIEERAK